jgi:pilus assembly protein Flp/PilA
MNRVREFLTDESGVTAIEYALIASLIVVFVIAAITIVGQNVSNVFTEIGATLK